jgi:hypothetical protein
MQLHSGFRQTQGDITADIRPVPGFNGLRNAVMHKALRSGKVNRGNDRLKYGDIIKMGSEGVDRIHLS